MIINALSLNNAGSPRVSFAQAPAPLVAQALTDAHAWMERHFPGLGWPTWGGVLRERQLDLLVHGEVVGFDWQDLARRVQVLAACPALPAAVPLMDERTAAALAVELHLYHRPAVPGSEPGSEPACGPLAYALLRQLAHGQALAARGAGAIEGAIEGAMQHPAHTSCPPAPEPHVPLTGPVGGARGSLKEGEAGPGLASPGPRTLKKGSPSARRAPKRRTFRDIVVHHPRGDGRFGFTVRELCTTMHISAASLTHARRNPGHLGVGKIMALAAAMGEHPLHVLRDLLDEAAGKKRRKRKNG